MKRFLLATIPLSLAACAGVMLPTVTPSQVQWAESRWPGSGGHLASGRELYVARCSGCHNLVLPSAHGEEEWKGLVEEMAPRAKLTDAEKEEVFRYLVSARETPPAR